MKKKLIITFTICLFAVGSIFNMNLAQNDQNMDISLSDISVMAQAGDESGDCPGGSCKGSGLFPCSACCPEGKYPYCSGKTCECI
jgi:hypothetical protein